MTKAVVFDLDGTLLNTLDDLADSCNKTLAALGYPERALDEVRQFVGNGIPRLIRLALPEGTDDAAFDKAVALMRKIYAEGCAVKTLPYDGITDLMKELSRRGIHSAVVSNKPDEQVKTLCRIYFSGLVEESACIGDAEGRARKPAPDGVYEALRILGIPKECAVYVGDSEVDIATARAAALPCISVTWGFRTKKVLLDSGAGVLADHPLDILNHI